jgi:hypothetical protein
MYVRQGTVQAALDILQSEHESLAVFVPPQEVPALEADLLQQLPLAAFPYDPVRPHHQRK